ncbi:hypothetical protein DYB25_010792, partial [Aphanomyces astaci]
DLEFAADEKAWCTLKVEVNNKVLGKKLGKGLAAVKKQVEALTHEQALQYQTTQTITLNDNVVLSGDDLLVKRDFKGDKSIYEADVSPDGRLMVVIDVREDDALRSQGFAREFVNRVQKLRKKAGLVAVEQFAATVAGTLGTVPAPLSLKPHNSVTIVSEMSEFAGSSVEIFVARPAILFADITENNDVALQHAHAYVATMEYAKVRDMVAADAEGAITVTIQDEVVQLVNNKDLFFEPKDKVAHTPTLSATFKWMV